METLRNIFQAALRYCLQNTRHGEKTTIAKKASVPVSTLLNLESGRRGASEENRRKIASALGFEYQDFLELGKRILRGDEIDSKTNYVPLPKFDEPRLPIEAVVIIEKLLYIAENTEEELGYISSLVEHIYQKAIKATGAKNYPQ